jgi:3-oxoacyl-[acyl-carrier-protein] synthase III
LVSLPEALLGKRSTTRQSARANAVGLGCAVPDPIVHNASVAKAIGVDDVWIERRTGIRARRHAPAALSLLDLAAESARAALDDANLDGAELDLVILATVSHERRLPNVAPQLAAMVGAGSAGAFDLGAACSGFVTGIALASASVEAGIARHVLVVGADMLSRYTDPNDRATAGLFGDGAGAMVLSAGDGGGVSAVHLASNGAAAELIVTDPRTDLIRMEGAETFKVAVDTLEEDVRAVCERAGADPLTDVDLFVFHQANGRITRALTERLGVPRERVVDGIAEVGNTSAASIPLALEHARADGRLSAGTRVLLGAVGAGFASSAALLEWGLS